MAKKRGPKPRELTDEELGMLRARMAGGMRPQDAHRMFHVDRHTWPTMKERQPAITEAMAAGEQQFHDSLIAGIVRIARGLTESDPRVMLDAQKFLLASRYNYRDRTPTQVAVGVAVGSETGEIAEYPTLRIIAETVEAPKVIAGPGGPIELGDVPPHTRRMVALKPETVEQAASESQEVIESASERRWQAKKRDLQEYTGAMAEGVAAVERARDREAGFFPPGQRRQWAEKQPAFRKATAKIDAGIEAAAEESRARLAAGEFGKA